MKTKLIIPALFLLIFSSGISCRENPGDTVLAGSNGKFNEVLVIIDHKLWEGKTGMALRKKLQANIPGLPQPEPLFSVMQIDPDNFSGSLRKNRNIIRFFIGDTNRVEIKKDLNASPQIYVFITGKSQEDLLKLIDENMDTIIRSIRRSDIEDIQRRNRKSIHKKSFVFFQHNHLPIQVPDDYELIDDREDFIWFRKRFQAGHNISGSMNIFCHTIPGYIDYDRLKDSIIPLRNKMGKKYIPGPFEDSYLTTEAAYTPHIFPVRFHDTDAYKTLGKWEVYNDFQAGPFVNITFSDRTTGKTYMVEGVVYAPAIDKRDMMFEVEAIIKTLKIDRP